MCLLPIVLEEEGSAKSRPPPAVLQSNLRIRDYRSLGGWIVQFPLGGQGSPEGCGVQPTVELAYVTPKYWALLVLAGEPPVPVKSVAAFTMTSILHNW